MARTNKQKQDSSSKKEDDSFAKGVKYDTHGSALCSSKDYWSDLLLFEQNKMKHEKTCSLYFLSPGHSLFTNCMHYFFLVPCPLRRGGGYEGVHHTPSVIWFRAYSSTNLCMAFVSTGIRTPALVVRSQSSIHWATPQLA